jgi:hypothetical protein
MPSVRTTARQPVVDRLEQRQTGLVGLRSTGVVSVDRVVGQAAQEVDVAGGPGVLEAAHAQTTARDAGEHGSWQPGGGRLLGLLGNSHPGELAGAAVVEGDGRWRGDAHAIESTEDTLDRPSTAAPAVAPGEGRVSPPACLPDRRRCPGRRPASELKDPDEAGNALSRVVLHDEFDAVSATVVRSDGASFCSPYMNIRRCAPRDEGMAAAHADRPANRVSRWLGEAPFPSV